MTTAPLDALLSLQGIDTDLDRHRHRRIALPERQAAAELTQHIATIDAQRSEVQVLVDDVTGRQDALEADLAATEARITDVNKRLYSGQVAASRDLQAMSAEVKALQVRGSDLEDRVLEVLDEREPHDQAVAALDAARAEAVAGLDTLTGAIAEAEEVIDAEIVVLAEQRAARAAEIPTELLATYEQIRSGLGGVGAARLIGAQCQGCFLTLPAAEVDRIKHLPDAAFVTCEDCGRILIHTRAPAPS